MREVSVLANNQRIDADAVVLCGGAHTGLIDARLRLEKSLIPIRGQILLLKTERPLLRSVINVGQRYLIGREDGHVLVGSSEEEVGFRGGTTDTVLTSLRQFADRVCPALRDARYRHRLVGLATDDVRRVSDARTSSRV